VTVSVTEGNLPLRSVALPPGVSAKSSAMVADRALAHELKRSDDALSFVFADEVTLHAGEELVLLA
jgi:hypothetical protein